MAKTGTVKQEFVVEVDKKGNLKVYNSNLKKVSKTTKETTASTKRLGAGYSQLRSDVMLASAAVIGIGASLKKLISYQAESVEFTKRQILADTRLANIARGVAGATDTEIKSLKNLADTMQDLTGIGDEAVEMGQSQLLSFGITAKSAEKLTESMLDLAVATYHTDIDGEKLIQTTNLMGKALNGLPGTLSRVGVLLDENQAKMMKEGNEAQRVATMIEIVEQNYDDLARAIGETPLGTIQRLDSEMGDLREEMGESFLPVIVEFKTAQKELMEQFAETGGLDSFNNVLRATIRLTKETISWWVNLLNAKEQAADTGIIWSDSDFATTEDRILRLQIELAKLNEEADSLNIDAENRQGVRAKGFPVDEDAGRAAAEHRRMVNREIESVIKKIVELEAEVTDEMIMQEAINNKKKNGKEEEKEAIKELTKLYDDYYEAIGPSQPEDLLLSQIMDTSEMEAKQEEQLSALETFMNDYGAIVQQGLSFVDSLFSSVHNRQMDEIRHKSKMEIEAVKKSTKSEKQKAKEIEKINAKAAKEEQRIREKQWRSDVLMSVSNTALAVTAALPNYPLAIATGVLGAASTAVMLANKPKYYYGSKDAGGNYSEVNGFGSGDTVDAKLKPKELVVEASKAGSVKNFLNGKTPAGAGDTYSYQISPVIQIAGDATPDSEDRIKSTLVYLMENEEFLGNLNPALVGG
ncbi:MAG: hypothetical protein GY774_00285 [Planctomycetes bacterium]|nr:hypothetical protein [Planctomycetota bacterium]